MSQSGSISNSSGGGVPTPASLNKGDVVYAPSANTMGGLPISTFYGSPLGASDTGLPAYMEPSKFIFLVDDFISGASSAGSFSTLGWNFAGSNSPGLQQNNFNFSGHPGYVYMDNSGAFTWSLMFLTASGYGQSIGLGYGLTVVNFWMKLNQLSSASDRFYVKIGLGNTNNDSDDTNSVAFQYQDNVNSGNWQLVTQNGGVKTATNSSAAADTNWHKYSIVINADGTLVTYYIDNVSVGTNTTNIPTSSVSPSAKIQNTGNYTSGNQYMVIDLFTLYMDLTTAR